MFDFLKFRKKSAGNVSVTVAAPPTYTASPQGLVKRDSVVNGVPAFWFARAINFGSQEMLHEPFSDSVFVQRAVKMISGPVASVPIKFVRPGSDSVRGRVPSDNTIDIPGVAEWLQSPMKGLSYSDFIEASIGWLKLKECFWLLGDDALVPFPDVQKLPYIIVARPDRMRHIVENGEVTGWDYVDPSGKHWSLLPEQVIHLRYWNPYDNFRGLGEYRSASVAAEADWLAGKFSKNLMSNNGDTGPFIIAKNGAPSDAQREQIISDLKAKRAAQLRGDFKPIFMTGDIEVQDPQIRSVDTAFISSRMENRHEIAIAFGVPPSLFDVKAAYSIGSASDLYQLIQNTCIPTSRKLADALSLLILRLTKKAVHVEFDWSQHPVMQEVRKERLASIDTLANRGMPINLISDYLGLGLPRFEGDDVGYLPMGVAPVSAMLEPAPEPATSEDYSEPKEETEDSVKAMCDALRKHKGVKSSYNKILWMAHMRKRFKYIRMFESKFNRELMVLRTRVLRNLDRLRDSVGKSVVNKSGLIDAILGINDFGKNLNSSFTPIITSSITDASAQVLEEIGFKDPWKFPPAKLLSFISERENKIVGVGDTVFNQLKTVLHDGLEKGENVDDLASDLKSRFNSLSKTEARRIAMTETGVAFNYSRDESMKAAGVKYKRWLSSHGPNVREAHAEAEERYSDNPIPMSEPYEVDGEQLMYPGDPSGSPGNVINCQCISIAAEEPEK